MNEMKFNINKDGKRTLWMLVIFAFVLRITIGMGYSNSYDTEWNIMWAVELGEGFFNAYEHLTKLDYPPLYLYPLYLVGRLINIDAIGGYQPFRMLAIKFFPCLADSLTCALIYKIGSKRSKTLSLIAASLWAVDPAVIFNCGFWGQTDCVMIFLAAVVFWLLGERRLTSAGVMFALLCSTKLQGMYLAPVVGMELLNVCFGSLLSERIVERIKDKRRVKAFLKFFAAMFIALAAVYLPFIVGSGGLKPLTVYQSGVDTYQYCTFNADNMYFWAELNGVKDDVELFRGFTVSMLGNIMLIVTIFMVAAVYIFGRRRSHWLAAFMLIDSIFMLTCRQHERYQIMALIMLIGAFVQIADKRLLTLFWLHTLVIFVNEARVLGSVHEKGADWLVYNHSIGLVNSTVNILLYVASVIFVLRFYFDKHFECSIFDRLKMQLVNADDDEEFEEAEAEKDGK